MILKISQKSAKKFPELKNRCQTRTTASDELWLYSAIVDVAPACGSRWPATVWHRQCRLVMQHRTSVAAIVLWAPSRSRICRHRRRGSPPSQKLDFLFLSKMPDFLKNDFSDFWGKFGGKYRLYKFLEIGVYKNWENSSIAQFSRFGKIDQNHWYQNISNLQTTHNKQQFHHSNIWSSTTNHIMVTIRDLSQIPFGHHSNTQARKY